jgi:hypothetical protein
MKIPSIACIVALLLLQACVTHEKDLSQPESEEDFFRLVDPSTGATGRKPAVVNPKKSVLPVGPQVIPMSWNETTFAYFGGWGQLVSADVHHFYIDTEAVAASLDVAQLRKPIYLQLRQKSSDRVHIELFMSNGEYPTPGKHKFSCNTKDSASVTIKLPPFTQNAHWLIRVQPSEPMSVWSKSLEYSLRLYERETTADTFSETWEGFFVTFLLVLGSTVALVFYIRTVKTKEAKQLAEDEKRKSTTFHNLNSDQQLLSLTEAQEQAKQGQLEQTHALNIPGRTHSMADINRVVDAIIRRASPDTNAQSIQSSPATLQSQPVPSTSATNSPTKTNTNRSQVFTRGGTITQEASAAPSNAAENQVNANKGAPSPVKSTTPSITSSVSTTTAKATASSTTTQEPTKVSVTAKATAKATATSSTAAQSSPSTNVKKMTAFWAGNAK